MSLHEASSGTHFKICVVPLENLLAIPPGPAGLFTKAWKILSRGGRILYPKARGVFRALGSKIKGAVADRLDHPFESQSHT